METLARPSPLVRVNASIALSHFSYDLPKPGGRGLTMRCLGFLFLLLIHSAAHAQVNADTAAETYAQFMQRDPVERAFYYFGSIYGAVVSDRSTDQARNVLASCAYNYKIKDLQADIERDLGNLVRVTTSPTSVDIGPLIPKAVYATCLRKTQN
jgi:hypothetical protein